VWHFVEDPKARQKIVSMIWLPIHFAIDCQFVLLSIANLFLLLQLIVNGKPII